MIDSLSSLHITSLGFLVLSSPERTKKPKKKVIYTFISSCDPFIGLEPRMHIGQQFADDNHYVLDPKLNFHSIGKKQ